VAYLIFDILSDPDARRPMFGMSVPMTFPFKVALKTGTTKAYTDLWALGTTREYTVGVWAGNFDGSPTDQVRSVHGATPLMRAAVAALAARFGDPTAPDRPDGIVTAEICPLSGKRPGPNCEHRKTELFIRGRVPEEICDWHQLRCGERQVVFPEALRPWIKAMGEKPPKSCAADDTPGVRIVSPLNGARFILEPHRPATLQRPNLTALPAADDITWTIDNTPADQWTPKPGTHTVRATRGTATDEISIVYE
jgi:penicillin-binding protein 1C